MIAFNLFLFCYKFYQTSLVPWKPCAAYMVFEHRPQMRHTQSSAWATVNQQDAVN